MYKHSSLNFTKMKIKIVCRKDLKNVSGLEICKNYSQLICIRHTPKKNDANAETMSNEVIINLNMFCVFVNDVIVLR